MTAHWEISKDGSSSPVVVQSESDENQLDDFDLARAVAKQTLTTTK
jgi:hypothetical protein